MSKIIYITQPEPPLTREEIAKLFGKMSPRDPLPRALRQILQERLAQAISDGAGDKLAERSAGHVAGRTAELLELVQELAQLFRPEPK